MSEAIELLKKSSLEIKRERHIETVPINEIYEIFYKFHSDDPNSEISIGEIYKQIGLSPRSFKDDQAKGQARKVTKYALLGLLAEQKPELRTFTHTELGIIFSALTHHIQTRAEPYRAEVKEIQRAVMQLMLDMD